MCDFLDASRKVPLVAIERAMPLADVIAARKATVAKPSWFAIFIKAYAAVSAARPELRRVYLARPWGRFFQYNDTVANLAVARTVNGEDGVLGYHIRSPERLSLADIDDRIRAARTAPVGTIPSYRRALRIARLPGPVRRLAWWVGLNGSGRERLRWFGTFGVTAVAALGSATLSLLSPLTTTVTYGVFRDDGTVTVRLFFDHRVLDGVGPAQALGEMEQVLRGPIVDELMGRATRAA
jgi:hypothetical protein